MHKPESVLENEMHKIPWDFEIQADHLIPSGKLMKKENLPYSGLCRLVRPQTENQRKLKEG